ncbi:hypothetical protein K469DRAFT_805508 [Zopfia rhizophila CBS 207.26]|uniref:NB-ARC domain-containing protein n=1 Tax=Zopfia rhizophila CBS 207.26 TaxID=1314779 RepID=A0A6A6ELN7_9PEZI|nr:hypothetical protein K469DRAFT_805508 [Zopfia rhizophila CBS 207.26]
MQKLFVTKECQKMALVGLGGIGKTQVALEFAYSVKRRQLETSIFWMPVLSLESFEQACAEIARILRIRRVEEEQEDVKELVRQHLSSRAAGKWLLIVDNADNMDILFGIQPSKGVVDYLPESEDGLTVFTTRHQEVAESLVRSDVLELENLGEQEAVEFLEKSLVRKTMLRNNVITTDLLIELDYLALAIAQAAAYINTNKTSISEYLWLLKNTDEDVVSLISREFRDNTRYKDSTNAVATTWVVSFKQIQEHDAVATDLLAFMSCIEWKAIPRSILPTVQPEERMMRAISTICSYSFAVKRDGEDVYDIHRLVHLATRIWINRDGRGAETRKRAIQHVAKVFPSGDYASLEKWREFLPHAVRLSKVEQEEDLIEKYRLFSKIGQCLRVDGRIRETVTWLEESHRWQKSNLPESDPDRLLSQHQLAGAYQANGQVKEAIELLEHVVAVKEKELAKNHPDRLASQHELARAYHADGQVKKAVELLERVVAELAENHPNQLASQHELVGAYHANGQVKKAVELLEDVVTHELVRAYHADGQVKKAVELLEYVVAVEEKELVENHFDRLASQHELARAYYADG